MLTSPVSLRVFGKTIYNRIDRLLQHLLGPRVRCRRYGRGLTLPVRHEQLRRHAHVGHMYDTVRRARLGGRVFVFAAQIVVVERGRTVRCIGSVRRFRPDLCPGGTTSFRYGH